MNIKSLLLGSAAALAVVSGAQAADAIVAAEPEPMEYVRVCDAFGTGYFYIPGTETCLKISGRVRYTTKIEDLNGSDPTATQKMDGRVAFDAKNDSEFGTISSMIRLGASEGNDNAINGLDGVAFKIKIGGLEFAGNDNTMWADGHGGLTDDDGFFNSAGDPIHVGYTADFGSGSVFVSLDHNPTHNVLAPAYDDAEKYLPNIAAGGKVTFGDYIASASIGYDEYTDSFAAAATVSGNVGIVGFVLTGLYSDDANNFYYAQDGFSVLGSVSVKATDSITVAGTAQWFDNPSKFGDYHLVGDVSWAVASGFTVLAEGTYDENENKGAFLRVTRSF